MMAHDPTHASARRRNVTVNGDALATASATLAALVEEQGFGSVKVATAVPVPSMLMPLGLEVTLPVALVLAAVTLSWTPGTPPPGHVVQGQVRPAPALEEDPPGGTREPRVLVPPGRHLVRFDFRPLSGALGELRSR